MSVAGSALFRFAEGTMIEAPRVPRTPREDRRVANHHLLDEDGADLGTITSTDQEPTFGPLEPTIYLRRESDRPSNERRASDTKASETGESHDDREGVR